MTTAITVSPVMDAASHKDSINAIQSVLADVMIDGIHYGPVPGCGNKPCLLKPGAEKIMATFGIRPEIEVNKTVEPDGHYTYEVKIRALSHDGAFLGEGIGEGSTREEKYAWENAKCEEHFDATPEMERRTKWRTRKGRTYQDHQVRTNPADKANTVLKMSKKRALVDMVLTVTAASDIFEQDLDEEHTRPADMAVAPEPVAAPKRKSAAKPKAKRTTKKSDPTQGAEAMFGTVTRIDIKEGEGARGPWMKYGICLDDKEWINTFDADIGGFAQENENGPQVIVHYKEDSHSKKAVSIGHYAPDVATPEEPAGDKLPGMDNVDDDGIPF